MLWAWVTGLRHAAGFNKNQAINNWQEYFRGGEEIDHESLRAMYSHTDKSFRPHFEQCDPTSILTSKEELRNVLKELLNEIDDEEDKKMVH